MQVVQQQTVTICDRQVVLTIFEEDSGIGHPFRQAIGSIDGKDGPVTFAWIDSTDKWDTRLLRDFLASIQ